MIWMIWLRELWKFLGNYNNMKKVLIWNTFELKPTGGPSGYLYNLKNFVVANKIHHIIFLSDITDINKLKISKYSYFIMKFFKKILDLLNIQNSINISIFIKDISNETHNIPKISLDEFDYVHFHTTFEFVKYSKLLHELGFNGKTILTTHTPKPTYLEIIEDWNNLEIENVSTKLINQLKKIDSIAFNRADILLYPDKTALEPYFIWDEFNTLAKKNNYQFIPTGINLVCYSKTKDLLLKEYDIPKGSFIISYVGRHNETKGFDLLKIFGEYIIEKYNNVYFLVAGKETPIQGLESPRWIEVGWTNDPFSIINACDLFVLPNKETFFDLILLEVMSLNKPVLLTNTGGNKFFKNKNLDLYYFESSNIDSMITVFEHQLFNKQFFHNKNKDYVTLNLMISNYTNKYLELLNEL